MPSGVFFVGEMWGAVLLIFGLVVWAGSDPLLVTCGDRAPP